MMISVLSLKITNLMKRIQQLLAFPKKACRWIAGLLGKMIAMVPVVGKALLHIKYLQRDLSRTLHQTQQNWEATCKLSNISLQELRWWKTFTTQRNSLPIQRIEAENPKTIIHVDASNSGWGVSSELITASGFWARKRKPIQ
jgi:hypothetical protein